VKGHQPLYTDKERAKLLSHIDLIDQVLLGSTTDMYAVIKKHKPDVIALGYDQVAFVDKLAHAIESFKLNTKIVRLKPHQKSRLKSSKIKIHLAQSL
jgi:FAD synthetase